MSETLTDLRLLPPIARAAWVWEMGFWAPLLSFGLSVLIAPAARKLRRAQGWMGLGGVVVLVACWLPLLVARPAGSIAVGIGVAGGLVWLAGLVADVRGLSAAARWSVRSLAVLVLLYAGVGWRLTGSAAGPGIAPWGEWLLTYVCALAAINAFHALAPHPGLLSACSAISAFFLGLYAAQTQQTTLAVIAWTVTGATAGLLPYDVPLRRAANTEGVALGESGASFLGVTLVAVALLESSPADGVRRGSLVPLLFLLVPMFYVGFQGLSRWRTGVLALLRGWLLESPASGKGRLLAPRMRANEATALFCLIHISVGISAILLRGARPGAAVLILGQSAILFVILTYTAVVVSQRHRDPQQGSSADGG